VGVLSLPAAAQDGADLSSEERSGIVERLDELLRERYVFEDVAAAMGDKLLSRLANGDYDDYDSAGSLGTVLTNELQQISHDLHLRVRPTPPRSMEPSEEEQARRHAQAAEDARRSNYGFEQLLRLPGNVGLLDLRSFTGAEGPARDVAMAAMNYLAACDALIVDLRQNGGGDPAMVQLISSYLFDEPTHLNNLYYRAEDSLEEFWTLDEVVGRRMPDVPVFVLTSRSTFSAAEEFTYNLKCLERATIVGETTGGGAHPGGTVPLHESLSVFIPSGRAINPISGKNWEGSGVLPDVEIDANSALDKALEMARRAASDYRENRT
jgi:C-terminal processing protease CtpA/Prc